MNTCLKLRFSENLFSRIYTSQNLNLKLNFPKNLFSRIYTSQKLHLAEITISRKLIFQNLRLSESMLGRNFFPESIFFLRKFILEICRTEKAAEQN